MSLIALNLADLSVGMPGLTTAVGTGFAEAAAVCLEQATHLPGVACHVSGTHPAVATINWQPATIQQRAAHADMQEATEDGAAGIAILAVLALTGLQVMERAAKGTGVDYWLGHDVGDDDALPFQNLTRLEVSGILSGEEKIRAARIQKKLAQTYPTDHVCPAYIAVAEFSEPIIHLEAK